MKTGIAIVGFLACLSAALCWLRASTFRVPGERDEIVRKLQRSGRWNATAAGSACIALACEALLFMLVALQG